MGSLNFSINRHNEDGSKYVPVKALIPTDSCGTPSALLPASNFQTLGGVNLDSRIREDIVDRGIEKGEWEMRNLSKQLGYESSDQEPHVGRVGEHNSGQMVGGRFRPDWHHALSTLPRAKTCRSGPASAGKSRMHTSGK